MEYCYVLFVRSGDEDRIQRILSGKLDTELHKPFVPKKAMKFRRFGVHKTVYRNCFPGYLFFQTDTPPLEFRKFMYPFLRPIKEAFRFLHYGNDRNDIALKEIERQSLLGLLDDDFTIDCLLGVMEGDKVRIISGIMSEIEGNIKKINPRKREVTIEIQFMGELRPVTLGLEIIEKVRSEPRTLKPRLNN